MRTDNEWLGSAEGPSGSFVVNSYGTFKVVYTAGKYGIDDGGSIRIARRGGMRPQVHDPKAPGYTTISSERKVRFVADSIPVGRITGRQDGLFGSRRGSVRAGHIRPFWGAFQMDVRDGSLYEGDRVVVTFGDASQGSPGIRLKASREAEHLFKVFVDPFGTGLFKPIHGSPFITIIGDEAKEIQVVGPSQVIAGSSFSITVRALDAGHNRSDPYRGKVSFDSEDPGAKLPEPHDFNEEDVGAHLFTDVTLKKPGLQPSTCAGEGTRAEAVLGGHARADQGDGGHGLGARVPLVRQGRRGVGLQRLAGERLPGDRGALGAREGPDKEVP